MIVMVDLLLALNLARLAGGERKSVCPKENQPFLSLRQETGLWRGGLGTGEGTGGGGEEAGRRESVSGSHL